MELPLEIWHQILLYADINMTINLTKIKKTIFIYCNRTQFWIDKFKHDDFTIFNNPSTINEYVKQYKLMVEAQRIIKIIIQIANIERQFHQNHSHNPLVENKDEGIIVIRWEKAFIEYSSIDDEIVPFQLKEAIKNDLVEGIRYYSNYIIFTPQDNNKYIVEYEMLDDNCDPIETKIIMSLSDMTKCLINMQYVILTKLSGMFIMDKDENLYYNTEEDIEESINKRTYQDIKKFFTRIGIRKSLEYQK
jgi:hypothetical protein